MEVAALWFAVWQILVMSTIPMNLEVEFLVKRLYVYQQLGTVRDDTAAASVAYCNGFWLPDSRFSGTFTCAARG
jgi:hypothetical protein